MQITKLSLITALSFLFIANSSVAALDKATFETIKKSNLAFINTYVGGLAEGMSWANAELVSNGEKPHYCLPESIPLNIENYIYLIEDEFSIRPNSPEMGSLPVGLFLFRALQRKFPCGK